MEAKSEIWTVLEYGIKFVSQYSDDFGSVIISLYYFNPVTRPHTKSS